MQILEELFYGNIPKTCHCNTELDEAIERMNRADKTLDTMLSKNEKKIYEIFKLNFNERMTLEKNETFIYAFSLGMKIAAEALGKEFN